MKKFLALVLTLIMIAGLVGCGGKKEESKKTGTGDFVTEDVVETPAVEVEVPADEAVNPAVEEYVNANKEGAEIDDEEMSMTIYAKGSSIVFDTVLKTVSSSDVTDEVVEFADEMLSDFDSLVELMQGECPEVESIIVNYFDADGGVIISKELK